MTFLFAALGLGGRGVLRIIIQGHAAKGGLVLIHGHIIDRRIVVISAHETRIHGLVALCQGSRRTPSLLLLFVSIRPSRQRTHRTAALVLVSSF